MRWRENTRLDQPVATDWRHSAPRPTTPMLNAAIAGSGLAYVPEDLAQPYLAKGALKRVLEECCPPFPGYHIYYPSRRQPSAAFARLVDSLRYRR